MTTPALSIPDYVTMTAPKSLSELARLTVDLLAEADAASLPVPARIELGDHDCDITLAGFGRDTAACKALATWADHHGAVLTGRQNTGSDGRPYVLCEISFIYQGASVTARAYIDPGS